MTEAQTSCLFLLVLAVGAVLLYRDKMNLDPPQDSERIRAFRFTYLGGAFAFAMAAFAGLFQGMLPQWALVGLLAAMFVSLLVMFAGILAWNFRSGEKK